MADTRDTEATAPPEKSGKVFEPTKRDQEVKRPFWGKAKFVCWFIVVLVAIFTIPGRIIDGLADRGVIGDKTVETDKSKTTWFGRLFGKIGDEEEKETLVAIEKIPTTRSYDNEDTRTEGGFRMVSPALGEQIVFELTQGTKESRASDLIIREAGVKYKITTIPPNNPIYWAEVAARGGTISGQKFADSPEEFRPPKDGYFYFVLPEDSALRKLTVIVSRPDPNVKKGKAAQSGSRILPVIEDEKLGKEMLTGRPYKFTLQPGAHSAEEFNTDCTFRFASNGPFCMSWIGGKDCSTQEEFDEGSHTWKNPEKNFRIAVTDKKAVTVRVTCVECN